MTGRLAQRALDLTLDMHQWGVEPDVVTYSTVIKCAPCPADGETCNAPGAVE